MSKDFNIPQSLSNTIHKDIIDIYDKGYNQGYSDGKKDGYEKGLDDNAFSEEDCIALLQKTGWMENHDKEIYLQGKNEAYENPVPTQDAYNQGLSDMFVALEKTFHMTNEEREKYLGTNHMGSLFERTPLYVLEKVRDYERDKEFGTGSETDEIKVGDVVKCNDAVEVVTAIYPSYMDTIDCGGNTSTWYFAQYPLTGWERTGKHIDIDSVLEQIRGGNE